MTIKVTYNVTDVYMSQSVSPVYINVSYSDGGASGGGVWGSITGTLSNQTDLQTALDLKLDESTIDGGTEGQILSKASGTDFDFTWINNYAKYLATNVRNQTGSTIGAFQVVYISGATGNKPLISLADADTEATSSKTYGVTATAIANNGTGDVVTAGELSGIDTSAFNEGDLLWLSTTAGGVVTSPPAEPAHAVFIGYVVRSHPTLGVIDVSIQNGYELNELHGVQITTPTDNQGLFYNSTSTLWENKSITTALGYTPVPTTRNITINGVTYDLSADRTWTIAAGISGSGASGQVTYWTGPSAVSGSNNLFWDNTNGRLGIGTNAPAVLLDVNGATTIRGVTNITYATPILNINVTANTQTSAINFNATDGTPRASITTNIASGEVRYFVGSGGYFATHYSNGSERMRLHSNGNFSIGTTSDLGVRLGVVGDTLLRGSGNTSATTALTVQNSSSTNLFVVRNDGNVGIGTNAPSTTLDIRGKARIETAATTELDLIGGGGNIVRLSCSSTTPFIGTLTNAPLGFFTSATERGRFTTNGNLMLGTTSDLGVRLGVVGDTILRGSGATSATTALTVQNSSSTNLFTVRNDGRVGIGTTTPIDKLVVMDGNFYIQTSTINFTGKLYQVFKAATDTGLAMGFYGEFASGLVVGYGFSSSSGVDLLQIRNNGNVLINTTTDIASSILTVNSTTKGFLPPRMTTTQKNAISTPAAGLVVYDTTLNKLCVYTTAWETITSI